MLRRRTLLRGLGTGAVIGFALRFPFVGKLVAQQGGSARTPQGQQIMNWLRQRERLLERAKAIERQEGKDTDQSTALRASVVNYEDKLLPDFRARSDAPSIFLRLFANTMDEQLRQALLSQLARIAGERPYGRLRNVPVSVGELISLVRAIGHPLLGLNALAVVEELIGQRDTVLVRVIREKLKAQALRDQAALNLYDNALRLLARGQAVVLANILYMPGYLETPRERAEAFHLLAADPAALGELRLPYLPGSPSSSVDLRTPLLRKDAVTIYARTIPEERWIEFAESALGLACDAFTVGDQELADHILDQLSFWYGDSERLQDLLNRFPLYGNSRLYAELMKRLDRVDPNVLQTVQISSKVSADLARLSKNRDPQVAQATERFLRKIGEDADILLASAPADPWKELAASGYNSGSLERLKEILDRHPPAPAYLADVWSVFKEAMARSGLRDQATKTFGDYIAASPTFLRSLGGPVTKADVWKTVVRLLADLKTTGTGLDSVNPTVRAATAIRNDLEHGSDFDSWIMAILEDPTVRELHSEAFSAWIGKSPSGFVSLIEDDPLLLTEAMERGDLTVQQKEAFFRRLANVAPPPVMDGILILNDPRTIRDPLGPTQTRYALTKVERITQVVTECANTRAFVPALAALRDALPATGFVTVTDPAFLVALIRGMWDQGASDNAFAIAGRIIPQDPLLRRNWMEALLAERVLAYARGEARRAALDQLLVRIAPSYLAEIKELAAAPSDPNTSDPEIQQTASMLLAALPQQVAAVTPHETPNSIPVSARARAKGLGATSIDLTLVIVALTAVAGLLALLIPCDLGSTDIHQILTLLKTPTAAQGGLVTTIVGAFVGIPIGKMRSPAWLRRLQNQESLRRYLRIRWVPHNGETRTVKGDKVKAKTYRVDRQTIDIVTNIVQTRKNEIKNEIEKEDAGLADQIQQEILDRMPVMAELVALYDTTRASIRQARAQKWEKENAPGTHPDSNFQSETERLAADQAQGAVKQQVGRLMTDCQPIELLKARGHQDLVDEAMKNENRYAYFILLYLLAKIEAPTDTAEQFLKMVEQRRFAQDLELLAAQVKHRYNRKNSSMAFWSTFFDWVTRHSPQTVRDRQSYSLIPYLVYALEKGLKGVEIPLDFLPFDSSKRLAGAYSPMERKRLARLRGLLEIGVTFHSSLVGPQNLLEDPADNLELLKEQLDLAREVGGSDTTIVVHLASFTKASIRKYAELVLYAQKKGGPRIVFENYKRKHTGVFPTAQEFMKGFNDIADIVKKEEPEALKNMAVLIDTAHANLSNKEDPIVFAWTVMKQLEKFANDNNLDKSRLIGELHLNQNVGKTGYISDYSDDIHQNTGLIGPIANEAIIAMLWRNGFKPHITLEQKEVPTPEDMAVVANGIKIGEEGVGIETNIFPITRAYRTARLKLLAEDHGAYTNIFRAGSFNHSVGSKEEAAENEAIRSAYLELSLYYYLADRKNAAAHLEGHFRRRVDQNVIGGAAHGRPLSSLVKGVEVVKAEAARNGNGQNTLWGGRKILFEAHERFSAHPYVYVVRSIPEGENAYIEGQKGTIKLIPGTLVGETAAFKKMKWEKGEDRENYPEEDPERNARVVLPAGAELIRIPYETFKAICERNPVFMKQLEQITPLRQAQRAAEGLPTADELQRQMQQEPDEPPAPVTTHTVDLVVTAKIRGEWRVFVIKRTVGGGKEDTSLPGITRRKSFWHGVESPKKAALRMREHSLFFQNRLGRDRWVKALEKGKIVGEYTVVGDERDKGTNNIRKTTVIRVTLEPEDLPFIDNRVLPIKGGKVSAAEFVALSTPIDFANHDAILRDVLRLEPLESSPLGAASESASPEEPSLKSRIAQLIEHYTTDERLRDKILLNFDTSDFQNFARKLSRGQRKEFLEAFLEELKEIAWEYAKDSRNWKNANSEPRDDFFKNGESVETALNENGFYKSPIFDDRLEKLFLWTAAGEGYSEADLSSKTRGKRKELVISIAKTAIDEYCAGHLDMPALSSDTGWKRHVFLAIRFMVNVGLELLGSTAKTMLISVPTGLLLRHGVHVSGLGKLPPMSATWSQLPIYIAFILVAYVISTVIVKPGVKKLSGWIERREKERFEDRLKDAIAGTAQAKADWGAQQNFNYMERNLLDPREKGKTATIQEYRRAFRSTQRYIRLVASRHALSVTEVGVQMVQALVRDPSRVAVINVPSVVIAMLSELAARDPKEFEKINEFLRPWWSSSLTGRWSSRAPVQLRARARLREWAVLAQALQEQKLAERKIVKKQIPSDAAKSNVLAQTEELLKTAAPERDRVIAEFLMSDALQLERGPTRLNRWLLGNLLTFQKIIDHVDWRRVSSLSEFLRKEIDQLQTVTKNKAEMDKNALAVAAYFLGPKLFRLRKVRGDKSDFAKQVRQQAASWINALTTLDSVLPDTVRLAILGILREELAKSPEADVPAQSTPAPRDVVPRILRLMFIGA